MAGTQIVARGVTVDQWDEAQMEIASLRADSREDAWHMTDPAKRLRESAIRDGRFHDFQDANVLVARIERISRRGRR